MSKESFPSSPESEIPLHYPAGWAELMSATDEAATSYQEWLAGLTELTQTRLAEVGIKEDGQTVFGRWQRIIEQVAGIAIDPEEMSGMTEAAIVETALLTLQANIIDGDGWEIEGLVVAVANLLTGEATVFDLRERLVAPPDN